MISQPLAVALSTVSVAEPLLSALLKLLAIVVQPSRTNPPGPRLVIPRSEAHAVGLDEADVRALLAANYVEESLGAGSAEPESLGKVRMAHQEPGLILTEKGMARIAGALDGLGLVSRRLGSSHCQPQWVGLPGGGGELRLGRTVLKRVRHDSLGQRRVLEEFERGGWPRWIPNPLPGGSGVNRKKALRDAIRRLNESQDPVQLRFHVHDGGCHGEIVE